MVEVKEGGDHSDCAGTASDNFGRAIMIKPITSYSRLIIQMQDGAGYGSFFF